MLRLMLPRCASFASALAVGLVLLVTQSYAAQTSSARQGAEIASEAQAALRQGNYSAAIRGFETLVKIAPAVAESHANLGLAYYSTNRFSEAAAQFQEALRLKPTLSNASYFRGLSLAKAGKCKDAVVLLG